MIGSGTTENVTGSAVRKGLIEGSAEIAEAVSTTFGPYGRNVAITMKYNVPRITKDGATVAGYMASTDPIRNVAIQIINQAANETAILAGDGTTSTTILSNELVKQCFEMISQGYQPMQLKRDLLDLQDVLLRHLEVESAELGVDQIKSIAMVACNGNEELANLVTEAFQVIGEDGSVTVVPSQSQYTTLEATEGIRLERSNILTNVSGEAARVKHENCKVLVTDLDITTLAQAQVVVNIQAELGSPLLIICNDLVGEAAEAITFHVREHKSPISIIRGPGVAVARRESLKDLAIVTGAKFISKDAGYDMEDVKSKFVGKADIVEITANETNIVGRHGDPKLIEDRINYYNELIDQDKQGNTTNYKLRRAYFTSGAAVLYVGGTSESEIDEKKDSLDDTIRAVRSALADGYVTGGGLTYARLMPKRLLASIPKKKWYKKHKLTSVEVMQNSLTSLMTLILSNSGITTAEMHEESVITNKIIDPTLVIKSTISNAIGAAILISTTDCVVVREELHH